MNGTLVIKRKSLVEDFFFSNYFYGICAVALSIEASLQQRFPLNGVLYFGLIFIATVLYYSFPYVRKSSVTNNPRTNWYSRNYTTMRRHQVFYSVILFIAALVLIIKYSDEIKSISPVQWILLMIFPAAAAFYYRSGILPGRFNLRNIGGLKPFVIGFTWAGLVTVYPVLFYGISNSNNYEFNWIGTLLFLKNLMFVAVLCIMFDIKDYTSDCLSALKTFVVGYGLRKTIFKILIPLSVIGLVAFVWYSLGHNFHPIKIILNIIPFILLIMVAYALRKRRSLIFYLFIVDGLMLAKAICGTIAITWF